MNPKTWIIAIMGESGSGKTALLDAFKEQTDEEYCIHFVTTDTTRALRPKEDPHAYHFISVEDFTNKILNYEYLEAIECDGSFYGTPSSEIKSDKVNIGIWTPAGVEELQKYNGLQVYPIHLAVSDKERWMRLLNRSNKPDINKIYKRYKQDREDFYDVARLLPFNWRNETEKDLAANVAMLEHLVIILRHEMHEADGQD